MVRDRKRRRRRLDRHLRGRRPDPPLLGWQSLEIRPYGGILSTMARRADSLAKAGGLTARATVLSSGLTPNLAWIRAAGSFSRKRTMPHHAVLVGDSLTPDDLRQRRTLRLNQLGSPA